MFTVGQNVTLLPPFSVSYLGQYPIITVGDNITIDLLNDGIGVDFDPKYVQAV